MTDPAPHGCTIDGQPAIPVRVDEYNQLIAETARLEAELGDYDQRVQQLDAELAALRQVARGYCPACGRGDAAPGVDDWERERKRADRAEEDARLALKQRQEMAAERYAWQERGERAEAELLALRGVADADAKQLAETDARCDRYAAALARIQALADQYPAGIDTALIHAALDTEQPAPAATQATDEERP